MIYDAMKEQDVIPLIYDDMYTDQRAQGGAREREGIRGAG
jgi:hypothetical protein